MIKKAFLFTFFILLTISFGVLNTFISPASEKSNPTIIFANYETNDPMNFDTNNSLIVATPNNINATAPDQTADFYPDNSFPEWLTVVSLVSSFVLFILGYYLLDFLPIKTVLNALRKMRNINILLSPPKDILDWK